MLISFSVENWMSYKNRVKFSMVASKERQHGERLAKIKKYNMRVLPISAIYGGNASGKTNLFKALDFSRMLVVDGIKPDSYIPVELFRLDTEMSKKPSKFSFELLIDEIIYEYSFAVTPKAILEEKLVVINSSSEKTLYHRKNGKPNFDSSLENDDLLQFAFRGTRDNQLFLYNSVDQNVDSFRPVYDWFKSTLVLIYPDSRYGPFEQFMDEGSPIGSAMNEMLDQLDTGIVNLDGEEIHFDNLPLPEPIKVDLKEKLLEGNAVINIRGEGYVVTIKDGELFAKKLVTYHANEKGEKIKFELHEESDGSQRVIDLLPAFLDLSQDLSKRVFVIDEIDRSLHTLLIRRLLEMYLNNCSEKNRSQLLFTTHDALLIDQKLFRRDEIWVAERDRGGVSDLFSFSDYKDIRYDKDILKSYLQGRLGGTPRIRAEEILKNYCTIDESEESN